jgi:hypothetical protein
MSTLYNPALHEEPRNLPTKVVPPIARESLLSWLESTGRFQNNETDELQMVHSMTEDLDDILESEYFLETNEEKIDEEE